MKFEIHHQAQEIVYDDENGNTVESPRGFWFQIVDKDGTVLAISELRLARRASVRKIIGKIIDSVGGSVSAADQLIVDRTEINDE